jgi:hypothetical protein
MSTNGVKMRLRERVGKFLHGERFVKGKDKADMTVLELPLKSSPRLKAQFASNFKN